MNYAAIDIGTNTVLCLIAESERANEYRVIEDRHAIARLGEGVDRTHFIAEDAFERFRRVLQMHVAAITSYSNVEIHAVATSAMRDATNREAICERVRNEFNIEIKILSGEEESRLTYLGAVSKNAEKHHPIGVLDIGGGSTELAIGTNGKFERGISLDIGAVRLTERYFPRRDSPQNTTAARMYVQQMLEKQSTFRSAAHRWIAVAGTPTSLAAMELGLQIFDRTKVEGYLLTREAVERRIEELASTTFDDLLRRHPVLAKGRADILLGGSVILYEVMRFVGMSEIRVSTQGLRFGVIVDAIPG